MGCWRAEGRRRVGVVEGDLEGTEDEVGRRDPLAD